jgi:trehalose-6-phosphate synthase
VLSRHAGASEQLRDALLIDPYDVDGSAHALARAVDMSIEEQARRMRKLRANVAAFDGQWWMRQLMGDAMSVHQGVRTESDAEATERSMFV